MTLATDRRSVLTGLGALGVMGCSQQSAQVATVPASPDPERGAIDLSAFEARHGGRLGFVAHDTGSNRLVAWRGDERFVYCSTFKLYLSAATLQRIQAGEERLDRAIPITAADMVSHAPVTEPALGSTLTTEQLMKAVVEVSDNPAANILIRELGGLDALRAWYRSIGDNSTTVDRLEPIMNRLDGDKDTITPVQSAANLHHLLVEAGSPLTPASRTRLMHWMFASPTGAARIKAGLPAGWQVAHKTGTGGYGPTNDIGIAYPRVGEPVVIAAYYHATSASTETQRDAVIAAATRMALAALGHEAAA